MRHTYWCTYQLVELLLEGGELGLQLVEFPLRLRAGVLTGVGLFAWTFRPLCKLLGQQ
jgi:hypothetical protein